MKKALTGAKLFTGENFLENKALLIEDKKIAGLLVKHRFQKTSKSKS